MILILNMYGCVMPFKLNFEECFQSLLYCAFYLAKISRWKYIDILSCDLAKMLQIGLRKHVGSVAEQSL